MSTTAGTLAARAWLTARALSAPALQRWNATILLAPGDRPPSAELDEARDTYFRIEIYSEEWGFQFCHAGRGSWIRVTDISFVHGRDDFKLLALTPALKDIGLLLRRLEREHALALNRRVALIRTNLASAEPAIREWVRSL